MCSIRTCAVSRRSCMSEAGTSMHGDMLHGLHPSPRGPTPLALASGDHHPPHTDPPRPLSLSSGYHQTTGEWLSLDTDRAQLVGIAAAFVTGVRFMVPLRMGAALALVPTVQKLVEGSSRGKE